MPLSLSTFLLLPPPALWDFLIVLLLAFSLSITIIAIAWLRRHRSQHLLSRSIVVFLGVLGFLGFLTITYGSFIEPQRITVTEEHFSLPLRESLRIIILSDMEIGPYKGKQFLERVVQRVNNLFPDLILIAGDFVYNEHSPLTALSPLAKLRSAIGSFAVLGNHDTGRHLTLRGNAHRERDQTSELRDLLADLGIAVLTNEARTFAVGADRLTIAGIADLWTGNADLGKTLQKIPTEATVIILSHNPDIILDPRSHRAHLIVTGHTHGGQIRLPIIGPLAELPTRIGQHFDQGLFRIADSTTLAITRGLGETLTRARLFAPPEILLLKTGVRLEE